MSSQLRRGVMAVVLAVSAAFIAACSDHMSPPGPALSQAQAESVSTVVTADVENELDAGTAATGIGFVPGAPFSGVPLLLSSTCQPSIGPTPVTNGDADPVPDSIRITFTDCVIGFRRGADTVRGSIDVVDPSPGMTDGSLRLNFLALQRIFVDRDGHEASVTQDGVREAIRDANTLSQTEAAFKTDYEFGNGATATHDRTWSIVFTADAPGSIVRDAPLPSGTLSIEGTSTLSHNGSDTFVLHASTGSTPLKYDATCADRPRFSTGTLEVDVTKQGTTTKVTIAFTACGQYTVTRS